jgi:hypothetical protein
MPDQAAETMRRSTGNAAGVVKALKPARFAMSVESHSRRRSFSKRALQISDFGRAVGPAYQRTAYLCY